MYKVRQLPAVGAAMILLVALAGCERPAPPLIPKVSTPASATSIAATASPFLSPAIVPPAFSATPTAPASATVRATPIATATATRTPLLTPAQTFRYVVQLRDTLTSIAAKFHTTVEALRALNELQNDIIVVGQQLLIPGAPPTATRTPAPKTPTRIPTKTPTPRRR